MMAGAGSRNNLRTEALLNVLTTGKSIQCCFLFLTLPAEFLRIQLNHQVWQELLSES